MKIHGKMHRSAAAAMSAIVFCTATWAFQQTADFGFGNDDSPTNVKSEFYWSRLAYTSGMQSVGGYGRRG